MKNFLVFLAAFIFSISSASSAISIHKLKVVAQRHLYYSGFGYHKSIEIEQVTRKSVLFAVDRNCGFDRLGMLGVVVDRFSGRVKWGSNDSYLKLHFAYSDTFRVESKIIYKFCAD